MEKKHPVRYLVIALILLLGVYWAFASAETVSGPGYPNSQFMITAAQLQERMESEPLIVVDVRGDAYFDGKVIPGAIRLPWSMFRRDEPSTNMGGLFIGVAEAQRILGQHGIFRNDHVILYDSVARDGGATASYLFWVLDLLGHQRMAILEGGIDGWMAIDGEVVNAPAQREALLYQAPSKEINQRKMVNETFIHPRLGDPYYQILDVRSKAEYLGEARNTGLDGQALKAGHIPGAFNAHYQDNWVDSESKAIKSHPELARMYRGLDPEKAVIVYCHSARRGSFGYYILRLMGFEDVLLYENSWFGWGRPEGFHPVETAENRLTGQALPRDMSGQEPESSSESAEDPTPAEEPVEEPSGEPTGEQTQSGNGKDYISCGG
jgi:thiosulfate/3-mercaptopyruvate sulfurtransferase